MNSSDKLVKRILLTAVGLVAFVIFYTPVMKFVSSSISWEAADQLRKLF